MKHLYILLFLVTFSFGGKAQQPLTDRILIEFMKPGDPDANARGYNLLPWPEEAKIPAYKAAEKANKERSTKQFINKFLK